MVVSNHGGRQLDRAVATAEALPEIVEAVAGRATVIVDGGIRRGVDVAIALALGADAVLVGRPVDLGPRRGRARRARSGCCGRFAEELELALALLGVAGPADLSHEHLRRALTTRVYSD